MGSSAYQGSLFSNDFIERSVTEGHDWASISADELAAIRQDLADIFARFPTQQTPNETQTEDDLIWRVLGLLGWSEHLRQQNLTQRGRQDVPDGIVFLDRNAKDRAVAHPEEWKRYGFGAAIVESKRWGRPLDRRSEQRNEIMAPSTQMLRYLRRVDDLTNGGLRWGILTNGARWRLYFSGARSVSEQFFEIDLASVLGVPGFDVGLFALTREEQDHWLKIFALMFRRDAFVPGADHRTFHHRAMDEGRFYEERVAQNLSDFVFGSVFPALAQGIAQAAPEADLEEVRDAALILDETLEPLIARIMTAFHDKLAEMEAQAPASRRLGTLTRLDPAMRLLELKICDPAMGSGHFPVSLVDKLADHIIEAMAEAEASVEWGDYTSPLAERIEAIRNTILDNAEARGWSVNEDQLDDRHIIRRMVLKRSVYGVDKNPMAVELTKVSLWLHTFTVGAPLSFLDHHLRAGDSLFGSWVRDGIDKVQRYGSPLLLHGPIRAALQSAAQMQIVEGLTDAEIAEAERSSQIFDQISDMTGPLNALLSFIHALDWLSLRGRENLALIQNFFDGDFGDPVRVLTGQEQPRAARDTARFADIFERAREMIEEEHFLHWQVAFPGIWSNWEEEGLTGGFDAIVGNPPWDRIKLQQVEWFAARRPEIARAQRASDRKYMVEALVEDQDPLARDFDKANRRAEAGARMARECGDYPLLSGGDINIYSLFVERAMHLVKPDGMVGLVTPSGIASDKTASTFFKGVSTEGRLKALYDFENRRTRHSLDPFFPAVDSRFKFCVFVASPTPTQEAARCAFFLQSVAELSDPEVCFPLSAQDFARVNPNTGTAPIFRSRRDADITTAIYGRLPVLVDRSGDEPVSAWPIRYTTMFHMTNDSGLFRTRAELEEREGAFHVGGNVYRNAEGDWVPLYVGRMIHIYDHRAASVRVNEANLHNAALSGEITPEEKADPSFVPMPQFWVPASATTLPAGTNWAIAFRDIARATDARTMICAAVPPVGYGNTAPLILPATAEKALGPELLANLAAIPLDYVVRQKAQSTHLNWYIVEQLPVVPPARYEQTYFGPKSAGEIVRDTVLELTYTAHDMALFAREMGHVEGDGTVKPPFIWDEDRRLHLRARLDALYFHLYGITDRDDVRYIYSTFPIVERQEIAEWGSYRSRDLCLAYMNALAAGHPDAMTG